MENIYSDKKKWITLVLCIFGFPFGLHAFYAHRIKRGIFFTVSLTGVFFYFFFLVFKISHSLIGHYLHFRAYTWFTLIMIGAAFLGHMPVISFLGSFGSYPVYLFVAALFIWLYDIVLISCGQFKDGKGKKIVWKKKS